MESSAATALSKNKNVPSKLTASRIFTGRDCRGMEYEVKLKIAFLLSNLALICGLWESAGRSLLNHEKHFKTVGPSCRAGGVVRGYDH